VQQTQWKWSCLFLRITIQASARGWNLILEVYSLGIRQVSNGHFHLWYCVNMSSSYVLIVFINVLQLWSDITSGKALSDPSLLSRFLLLTFAVSITITGMIHSWCYWYLWYDDMKMYDQLPQIIPWQQITTIWNNDIV
jgi:hypothetical protein